MIVTESHEFMDGRAVVRFGEWLGDRMEYEFVFDEEELFSGSDFKPSPLVEACGREAAISLLGFLTLQKGDTDSSYFDKYTERQLKWAASFECETLGCYIHDEELDAQD